MSQPMGDAGRRQAGRREHATPGRAEGRGADPPAVVRVRSVDGVGADRPLAGMSSAATDPPHLHAAFLSGINLGRRRLTMDELRGHFETFGLADVATFIASGNVIFRHEEPDARDLDGALEAHLAEALGFETNVLVRAFRGLEVLDRDAGVRSGIDDGFNAHALFLREPLGEEGRSALHDLEGPEDRFLALGGDIVWLRRGGLKDTPFPMRALDAAFGVVPRTQRNLNTVRRMLVKFGNITPT